MMAPSVSRGTGTSIRRQMVGTMSVSQTVRSNCTPRRMPGPHIMHSDALEPSPQAAEIYEKMIDRFKECEADALG